MNSTELIVLLACLYGGYWLAKRMLSRPDAPPPAADDGRAADQALAASRRQAEDERERAEREREAAEDQARVVDDARLQADWQQSLLETAEPVAAREWFEVLGVAPEASRPEIIAAYRQAISQYLPARLAHLDAGIQALGARRSQEIESAYDAGMRLHRPAGQ